MDNHGQAMIAVLVCLCLGGLIIAPLVSYAGTSGKSISLKKVSTQGLYAADAGIEKVLWALKYGTQPSTSLSQNMNGMQVTMNTVSVGEYTLVAGEWITTAEHTEDLLVSSNNITWDAVNNGYRYEMSVTWTGSGNCYLIGVGAQLPIGYEYQAGSAYLFAGNLCTGEPSYELIGSGAHIIDWTFPKIKFESPETRTQTFLITGSGPLEGNYGWAEGERQDVGPAGELIGGFYTITATATKNGKVNGKIEANVIVSGNGVGIISYRVLK